MIESPKFRRSERKTKDELLREKEAEEKNIEAMLLNKDDSNLNLQIGIIEQKGRGILTQKTFTKGDYIVEYCGELISAEEASAR